MLIRVVHEADNAYGPLRVTAELNDGAPPQERFNPKRVARVVVEHGIAGIRPVTPGNPGAEPVNHSLDNGLVRAVAV